MINWKKAEQLLAERLVDEQAGKWASAKVANPSRDDLEMMRGPKYNEFVILDVLHDIAQAKGEAAIALVVGNIEAGDAFDRCLEKVCLSPTMIAEFTNMVEDASLTMVAQVLEEAQDGK